jgi:hypothetical protein
MKVSFEAHIQEKLFVYVLYILGLGYFPLFHICPFKYTVISSIKSLGGSRDYGSPQQAVCHIVFCQQNISQS